MTIGVLKEIPPETRVSILPEHMATLKKWNVEVIVENNAGVNAFAENEKYEEAGAVIVSRDEIFKSSDMILGMNAEGIDSKKIASKILTGNFHSLFNTSFIHDCAEKQATVFSLEMLPRTTRAQSMDVLSSQANIAGYKAVVLAANLFPRYFPMFMTAAGSIAPAKVLILGAGVAGLQAIATARRLGGVVEVFDTRPAVKEEVMSLGAKFVEVEGAADASLAGGYAVEQTEEFLAKQKEKIAERVARADIIITTAQIPGRKAPVLINEEMLRSMKNGSLIVDLAADTGGNTSRTKSAQTVKYKGVSIVGNSRLASTMPYDASKLYGKNVLNFLQLIISDGSVKLNFEDDLVKGACVVHAGEITNAKVKESVYYNLLKKSDL